MNNVKNKNLHRVLAVLLSVAMVLSMLPFSTITRAATAAYPDSVTIKVIDKETKEPIKGAKVSYVIYDNDEQTDVREVTDVLTDDNGEIGGIFEGDVPGNIMLKSVKVTHEDYKAYNNEVYNQPITGIENNFEIEMECVKIKDVAITANDLTYNTEAQSAVSITGLKEGDQVSYKIDGEVSDDGKITNVKEGGYSVEVTVKRANFNDLVETVAVTMKKANIEGIDIAEKELLYDETDQELVTLTGADKILETDTVTWSVDTVSTGSRTIPQKKEIGKYKVKLVVNRGANYNVFEKEVTSNIDKGVLNLEGLTIEANNRTYDKDAQDAVIVTGQGQYALEYKLGENGTFEKNSIPEITEAGSYTVYVKATKTGYNEQNYKVYPISVTIEKAEQTIAFGNTKNITYKENNKFTYAIETKSASNDSTGKITYSIVEDGTTADAIIDSETGEVTYTSVGMVKVKAVIAECDNYKSAEKTYEIQIVYADFDKNLISMTEPDHTDASGCKWYQDKVEIKAEGWTLIKDSNALGQNDWRESLTVAEEGDYSDYQVAFKNNINGEITDFITVPHFAIDKTAPNELDVEFQDENTNTLSKIVHFLTFGLFCNEGVKVTVTCDDATENVPNVGVETVELFKYDKDGNEIGTADVDEKAQGHVFKLPMNFEGTVKVKVTDYVGNTEGKQLVTKSNSNMANDNGYIMIEETAPVVSDLIDTPLVNVRQEEKTHHYSGDAKIKFTAQDTGSGLYSVDLALYDGNIEQYISDYLKDNDKSAESDALCDLAASKSEELHSVPVYENGVENAKQCPINYSEGENATRVMAEYSYYTTTEKLSPREDGSYNFMLTVTDNAGNITRKALRISKDLTSPMITDFEFIPGEETKGKDGEACAEIKDYGYYFKETVKVNVSAKDPISENELSSGVKFITVVLVDKEGNYYTVDASEEIIGIKKDKVEEQAVAHLVDDKNAYSFQIKKDFKGQIYAFATDKVGNTPINSTFAYEDSDIIKGGVLEGYKCPNGTILETPNKHQETSSIVIEPDESKLAAIGKQNESYAFKYEGEGIKDKEMSYDDTQKVPLYNANPTFTLKVEDSYSGIRKIKTTVYENGKEPISDELEISNKKDKNGNVEKSGNAAEEWEVQSNEDKSNLVYSATRTIGVTGNHNNMVLLVELTDRAGNTTYDYYTFGIDMTAPVITVEMNDDDAPQYAGFFNKDREAKFIIRERNFINENVEFTATVTDEKGVKTDIVIKPDFKLEMEGANPKSYTVEDGSEYYVYTMSYVFDTEGDYTFDMKAKDLAENENQGVAYQNSNGEDIKAISTAFTVDKTLPTVSVTYDNNSAKNDKYFNASRTATIVITEHNFDLGLVEFTQTASLNGTAITIPSASWNHDGDVHTATIAYTADGDYTFDVKIIDKATNEGKPADYGTTAAGKEFVVDKTIAKPSIGGVVNGGAYKENVVPTISFNDVNYDSYELKLVRTRMGEKNVDVTDKFIKSVTVQEQGGSGSYDTFEKIVENDGIYTLTVKMTDKAGNEETEAYTFTVNRFGSVYVYSDYLISLIKDGGQYITITGDNKAAITDNLVITEYNADKLTEGSLQILITRDGETIDAKYSANPAVNAEAVIGESGWYEYVYTIDADNFAKDGVYKIALTSAYATVDSEKNESSSVPENSMDGSGNEIVDTMNFTVDTTAPEIRNVVNLEKAIVNAQKLDVKYTIVDIGGLKSVAIILNGKTIDTITEFGDSVFNYSGQFTINESTDAQTVQIKVTDLAGNVTDTSAEDFSTGELYVFNDKVTVSTNFFVRWYANKPLFWGIIGGVVVLAGVVCFGIATRKKKKEDK